MPSDQPLVASDDEYDIFLNRVETAADGSRNWRELFFARPAGFRPLALSLTVPPKDERPAPLVVYIHGGGWMFGHPDVAHPVLQQMRITETLADAGYAVARISYRLSGEGRFPMQLHDCKAAIRYLRHHAVTFGIEPERIAALGESAGAHLALMLAMDLPPEFEGDVGLTGESSAISAVVDWYGVTDLTALAQTDAPGAGFAVAELLGQAADQDPDAARGASPVSYVSPKSVPCLIQHGDADGLVPVSQGRALRDALRAAGVPTEYREVEGAGHCFVDGNTAPILPQVVAFLDRYLRG